MINREQEDDKAIFKKLKVNKKYKAYQRKGFFLSQKILDYYINVSNNNSNTLKNIFKLIKCENKDKV